MSSSIEAIFTGANRQTHIADIHRSRRIVAFGAGKTIALWNPINKDSFGIYSTLKGHSDEITCVRFIPDSEYLVTASEDSTIKLWKFKSKDSEYLEFIESLDHHKDSITSIGIFKKLIVTGDTNGSIAIWKLNEANNSIEKLHSFESKVGILPLSLAIQEIENNQYILALGGTKFQIIIYSFTLYDNKQDSAFDNFKIVAELEGHEDWVKALAFKKQTDGDYLLASGSQDRYIRLWRIRTNDLIDRSDEDETKLTLLSNKQYKFKIEETEVAINFEALIMGHDDWISSLQWHENKLQLLASSADTAMMVWEPDDVSGIWVSSARLGEISTKGASTATGSSGGFWASIWFSDEEGAEYILTNGKTGAWRIWKSNEEGNYDQGLAIVGATRHATDISWSINGDYLLSTSLDQTTRLYSKWTKNADGSSRENPTWQEFARPQIHGYDMICISTLSNTRFISGGDEKILRSFDEPRGVAHILDKFCDIKIDHEEVMPESASLPALGLSNKATSDAEERTLPNDPRANQMRETDDTNNISFEILTSLNLPPFEDHLQRHTLWPEIEKLYGHGYEIISVDTSPDKKLIASSCRSNTTQHAVIRLFDSTNWQEVKPNLKLHDLTVTRVKFSPDGKFLLTVSRDRKFGLWRRNFDDDTFELVSKNEKAHTRIIWDCSWAPTEFGLFFVTASRDKTVKLWEVVEGEDETKVELVLTSAKFGSAVTSIDIHKQLIDDKIAVAVGLEDGSLTVHTFSKGDKTLALLNSLSTEITPADRVARVSWSGKAEKDKLLLAAASFDNSTRIYSVSLTS